MFGMKASDLATWPYICCGFAILAVIGIVLIVIKAVNKPKQQKQAKTGATGSSWKSYLKVQGVVLCGFLLLGALLGWLSALFGGINGQVTKGVKLIEYRNLDLSQHPVYEEVETDGYLGITIIAKTIAPENGIAALTIYENKGAQDKGEVVRLESVANSWSQWKKQSPGKHISIGIKGSDSSGATPATQADILIYLSPK